MEEHFEKDLDQRKQKFIELIKKPQVWVIGLLIIALILGIYIRSLPMTDHGGNPGLWDITTNTWTLGPDLDPWLFFRHAKTIVEQGSLPEIDMMRNAPFGFNNAAETMVLPYMIAYTYKIINLFTPINIEFAGVVFPVIMFALTIIAFFLFVREIFTRKSKKSKTKANIIALISTFLMIVTPIFLSRTIAGIPEKESAAFFFMFLAFYLFLKAWKSEKIKTASIFGILAGISTALMGMIWGGVMYIFISIATATLIAFMLNQIHKKEFIIYSLWALVSIFTMVLSSKFTLTVILTSINSGLSFLVFIILGIHFLLWNTKISQNKLLQKIKLPKTIISVIIALILIILIASILFGPFFIIDKVKSIHQTIFKPVVGRWNTTVAENRQPYFPEWSNSLGPFIQNIPLMFWAFLIGSIVLFKTMLNKINKKDSWILTGAFILLLFGMIFSRYSGASIFNGENFISKAIYYGAVFLFLFLLIKIYSKYRKQEHKGFEKIQYEHIFLFVLLLLSIFSARGAVRLIMMLGPIAPIFLAYLIYESTNKFFHTKDETSKMILGILVIIIIILSTFIFWTDYSQIKTQSYNMVPSYYNQQWQKAMDWVRQETPANAVFGHWWDYGYWVQSIGERATVLDGGNARVYWNYLMGRHVLTGDNQDDALEFLYNHNTTHFLIDSTDIGKYGAFSSIGSNENYDRYSWISTLQLDESKTTETNNITYYLYTGGIPLDEDLLIEEQGKQIFLPAQQTVIGGVIIPFINLEDQTMPGQPEVLMFYNQQQHRVNLKYLSIEETFITFDSGIEATAFAISRIESQGQGITENPIGSLIFISPRVMRGMPAQKYLLNDPFNNFPNFKLVHTQQNLIIENLNQQGMNLPEFVYYQGIQGPIKIWEIEYTGKEQIREEYLDIDASKYLSWKL